MCVLTCTHPSPHPSRGESCAHSTLPGPPARQHPCMDRSDTFVGVNWCWRPTAPLRPCHNQKPAGIRQGLFRGGQACRARPRWVACLLLPGTDPAARHQRRSGGEHARGHSIWRHRQDQSDYLRPGHPCGAGDQKMGGRGTQGCPPITLLQCGCRQGLRTPTSASVSRATSTSSSPAPRQDHTGVKHSWPRTGSRWRRTTRRCWQPRAGAGAGKVLARHTGPGGGRAGGRQVPHGAVSSRWRRPLDPLSRARSHKVYGPHHFAVMEIVKSVSV